LAVVAITISVITPSLNHCEFLEETIRSVISQEGNFKIDYIIMDGCSNDGSLSIIRKYESLLKDEQYSINCCGITYRWLSEPDYGQTDAINKGFSIATGTLLGWLNSDDILLPGALDHIAKIDWKKYDLCYGQGRWISRDGKKISDYPTFRPDKYSLYFKCTLCQPAVYFSRETFDRLGKLSLEYNLSFDYEYWLRAVFSGEHFKRIPHMLAESRMYPDNKSLKNRRSAEWESWQLRKRYYCGVSLNRLLCAIYRYVIEKKTLMQENRLLKAIGDNKSQ
jgi:glycosyltransferase involved in cell wall biosynthesis